MFEMIWNDKNALISLLVFWMKWLLKCAYQFQDLLSRYLNKKNFVIENLEQNGVDSL